MAFEKMTADQLRDMFEAGFPNWSEDVVEYQKIGARVLKLVCKGGLVLYFMWYDETNWTLGTKLYRKRPEKQKKVQKEKRDLTKMLKKLEAEAERTKKVSTLMRRLYDPDYDILQAETDQRIFEEELDLTDINIITGGNQS